MFGICGTVLKCKIYYDNIFCPTGSFEITFEKPESIEIAMDVFSDYGMNGLVFIKIGKLIQVFKSIEAFNQSKYFLLIYSVNKKTLIGTRRLTSDRVSSSWKWNPTSDEIISTRQK